MLYVAERTEKIVRIVHVNLSFRHFRLRLSSDEYDSERPRLKNL